MHLLGTNLPRSLKPGIHGTWWSGSQLTPHIQLPVSPVWILCPAVFLMWVPVRHALWGLRASRYLVWFPCLPCPGCPWGSRPSLTISKKSLFSHCDFHMLVAVTAHTVWVQTWCDSLRCVIFRMQVHFHTPEDRGLGPLWEKSIFGLPCALLGMKFCTNSRFSVFKQDTTERPDVNEKDTWQIQVQPSKYNGDYICADKQVGWKVEVNLVNL